MIQPDVLYCIEHVGRELAIAAAVRHVAMHRYGVDVEVISLPHHAHLAADVYRPKLITVPGFLSRRGYGANAHLEQLFSRSNRVFRMPKDAVAREDVLHVAAGDFFKQWLSSSGVPQQNIIVVGSLPCQLYQSPYRNYFEVPKERLAKSHGLDPNKPWVLLAENFSAAFFSRSHIRHRLRHGYDKQALEEYVSFTQVAFQEIMRWCAAAALDGEVELIVRPRPAMSTERLIAATKSVVRNLPTRHLHFIKKDDLRSWVLASQMVISSYSTVLIEAAVARKPTLLLTPRQIPHSSSSEWQASAISVSEIDDFRYRLASTDTAMPDPGLLRWANDTLLVHGDAIENLARTLAEIVTGDRFAPTIREPSAWVKLSDRIRDGLKQGEMFARRHLRPRRKRAYNYDADLFDAAHVEAATARWSEVLSDSRLRQVA